jgi:hypothetical protein
MPTYSDVVTTAKDPIVFRRIVQELIDLADSDWTYWEENWLPAMLRYPKDHGYTETEREKLAQLCWLSEPCFGHDGLSVEHMITTCLRYHADFSESVSDFILELQKRGAKLVRRRELRKLVALCRESGLDLRAA